MEPTRLVEAIGHQETWEDKLHKEEETIIDQLGLTKYKCPCTMCFGARRPILRSTIPQMQLHGLPIQ
jgi:DNA-directed RNA polymerase subunit N (RpoN/RPB10)